MNDELNRLDRVAVETTLASTRRGDVPKAHYLLSELRCEKLVVLG